METPTPEITHVTPIVPKPEASNKTKVFASAIVIVAAAATIYFFFKGKKGPENVPGSGIPPA